MVTSGAAAAMLGDALLGDALLGDALSGDALSGDALLGDAPIVWLQVRAKIKNGAKNPLLQATIIEGR